MPLVKVSVQQLEAAQRLYEAATRFILVNRSVRPEQSVEEPNEPVVDNAFDALIHAVDRCKQEYEKYGNTTTTQD